ncbi:MAG: hypothetical protein U1E10_04765 [Bdellovibrionales bacterium]|nr:hypothetical protein [Bdellovibrionales bacterium]
MRSRLLSFSHFFVAHSVSATAVAFILSWLFGGLSPLIAAVSLAFSVLRARRFTRAMRNTLEWRAPGVVRPWDLFETLIFVFVIFASWKHFAWMMPTIPAGTAPGVVTLSLTNYGDLPLHINFIRALANGIEFLPLNPIFASEPLRYPFGPDLYNALWESLGFATSGHLFFAGLAATVSSLVLLRELGGAWAMAAFFLAGGAVANGSAGAGVAAMELDWKSFFLAIWITQRGMLWALPIGLMLLLYLRPHLSGSTRLPQRAVGGLGRMWAVFPLFHAHSFVIVSLMLFVLIWKDFGIRRTREFAGRFLLKNRALYWAIIPASLLIFHTSDAFSKASVVRLRWFWTLPENSTLASGIAWYWKNFGLSTSVLLLMSLGVFTLKRTLFKNDEAGAKPPSTWKESLIYLGFFAIFLFVMLAPWEWDNVKVLLWPWVLGFALLGRNLIKLQELKPSRFWAGISAFALVVGFHHGIRVVAESWEKPAGRAPTVWSVDQLAHAETVLQKISYKAVFLSAQSPTHVLAYFGRLRALGYAGHLWSHGISYSAMEADLEQFMKGAEDWIEIAKRLKMTHVYWGPDEKARWGSERRTWQDRLALIAKSGEHEVYEFKEAK